MSVEVGEQNPKSSSVDLPDFSEPLSQILLARTTGPSSRGAISRPRPEHQTNLYEGARIY
jgi:hypothetical protein